MRLATGVRAHFGASLNHLAIRALLVHTYEEGDYDHKEIGWGQVARNLNDIVLCDDDTVRVVYQGEISPAKYVRAAIPVPTGPLQGECFDKGNLSVFKQMGQMFGLAKGVFCSSFSCYAACR